jgi:SAM-dependent methyltransferase
MPIEEEDPLARLRAWFGSIDIYLFDQLLRGHIRKGMRVLDAGCGSGRNLVYLLREGFDVTAVDADAEQVERTAALAARLGRPFAPGRLLVASLEALPFSAASFDVVLCNAVLHFARDEAAFLAMVAELGRVLAPGGLLFARLASSIGIEDAVQPLGDGRFRLPDGTDRHLADEATLLRLTSELGGTLVDPLKTTNVQGLRCMTTWVVRKA